ncbi:hypothetical protein PoB_001712300 [Plakobranchus ocellatus]|uniref:Uncharacterized protein n=1 Tax=Plakobranchus ocellatus TaxID=259542 RepID=A0AAV3Z7C7_9GAST|nr:hypothetical protein PoB_001712300 [Plakobranchus ocellatus]
MGGNVTGTFDSAMCVSGRRETQSPWFSISGAAQYSADVFKTCAITPVPITLRYDANVVRRSRGDGGSGNHQEEQFSQRIYGRQ